MSEFEAPKEPKADKVDELAKGTVGGLAGAGIGWVAGTAAVAGAAALGVAVAPVVVPLAVIGGGLYGLVKGARKIFD